MKVGIFYPNAGDEGALMKDISLRISNAAGSVQIPGEQYMFILGFSTRMQSQPAIQLKVTILDQEGAVKVQEGIQVGRRERRTEIVKPLVEDGRPAGV
jgi:hypothetical protein